MFVEIIFIECIEDKAQEIYELYKSYSNGTPIYEGNLSFQVYKDENVVVLIEKWIDKNYLKQFLETEAYKNISKNLDGKIKTIKAEEYLSCEKQLVNIKSIFDYKINLGNTFMMTKLLYKFKEW